jgi:hypothetical protein
MRVVKQWSLVLVAVFALSAVAVSSASAAAKFLANPAGALSGKTLGKQTFNTAAGNVVCNNLKTLNTSAVASAETQKATIDYENCTAFGLGAVVTPVSYVFHANGTVDLIGHVTITAPSCVVLVFPKNGLSTISYRNLQGAVSIAGNVTGILSEGTGVACKYTEEGKGTYVGTADVWLTSGGSGTLTWEP